MITIDVRDITATSAVVGGVAYGTSIHKRGIYWSPHPDPTSTKFGGKGAGEFTITLSGLNPSTKYYYKAWMLSEGYVYGEEKSFTTTNR